MPQRHCGCRGMRRRLWNEDIAYICTPVSTIAIAGRSGRSGRSRSVARRVLAPFIGTRRRGRGPQRHEARWQLSLVTRSSESKSLDYQIGVHCGQRTGIKTSLSHRSAMMMRVRDKRATHANVPRRSEAFPAFGKHASPARLS